MWNIIIYSPCNMNCFEKKNFGKYMMFEILKCSEDEKIRKFFFGNVDDEICI